MIAFNGSTKILIVGISGGFLLDYVFVLIFIFSKFSTRNHMDYIYNQEKG